MRILTKSIALLLGLMAAQETCAAIAFRAAASAGIRQAAISYRASGTVASAASGNITPTLASVELNALLVCVVEQHDNVVISFPAGWTQLYSISTTATHRASAYYHLSAAAEANPLITHTGGNSIIAQCSTFRGADAANPLDVAYAAQYAASSTSVTSGSVTTLTANDMMLFAPHVANNPTIAAPTGAGGVTWTQRFYSSTALGLHSAVGLYTGTMAAAGAVGPITSTVSAASENNGVLMALHDGSRLSIPVPTGTVVGDVMVAAVATTPSTATITAPVGGTWQLIQAVTQATGGGSRLATYYRVATAADTTGSASYTWTLTTTHTGAAGGIVSYSGVDNTSPIDVSANAATASALTHAAPTITTAVPNDMLVTVHEFASASSWTPPAGMTERVDIASRAASTTGITLEMNDLPLGAAGATGAKTATAAANADTGATVSVALKPFVAVVAPDHIEIDYPAPPFSTCSPTTVTVYACGNAACSAYYTNGVSVTLSPGGNVAAIPSGSSSASGTVLQTTAGAGTLSAVSVPAALGATTCKNTSTGAFSCSVSFAAASLTVTVPSLTAGTTVAGTISGCTAQVPVGNNTINFYTGYSNPASGTKQATVNGTAIGTTAAGSTGITLNFSSISGSINQAAFNLSYPDVGLLSLYACKPNCTAPSASGNDPFIAAPDHFTLSNVTCGDGTTYVGCIVTSPYANPGAINASGAAFMKAGNPFSLTVTAYNGAATPAVAPNFGRESTPEQITLAPAANMPDLAGAVAGNLTCNSTQPGTTSCSNGAGTITVGDINGAGVVNARLLYDEAGIMTMTARLASGNYLGSGLKEITTPSSGNIGRFIPDHFTVDPDATNPILTQADFAQVTASATGTAAPATVIGVNSVVGFPIGSKVRIPGAGPAGAAFTATVTAVDTILNTLTLNTAIGTTMAGGESVISEWGTYMGEPFNAQFTLSAVDFSGNLTQNYQGAYAKLNPAAAGNPLGFGAVDTAAPTNLTGRLNTSTVATGSFSIAGATGSAAISAPLAINRGVAADGPYATLKIGIAPVDSDGVKMGTYDLNVGGSNDHTSIMDPAVQASTEVRFGRLRLIAGQGSEWAPFLMQTQTQYYDGTYWRTNTNDSVTTYLAGNFALSGTTGTTISTVNGIMAGYGSLLLTGAGQFSGTATICLDMASTADGCTGSSAGSLSYLRGNWGVATYDKDPSATVLFGGANSNSRGNWGFIYRRENF